MKKIFYLFACITFTSYAEDTKGIKFSEGTWAAILNEAKVQNKLIFVDIYTVWCAPCKAMAAKVFTDTQVGEKFNNAFINYKIDAEKGEGVELAKNYAITAYPTYLFVNPEGELVYRTMGTMPADKFMNEADKALSSGKKYRPTSDLEVEYNAGKRDAEFLYDYLKRKKLNGERSAVVLEEYLKVIPESLQKTEKVLGVISENISTIDSRAFTILADALPRFINMTPEQQKYVMDGISRAKRNTFKQVIDRKDKVLLDKLIEAVRATSYSRAGFEAEEKQFRLDYAKIMGDAENFKMIASKDGERLLAKTNEEMAMETQQKIAGFEAQAKAQGINQNTPQYAMVIDNMKQSVEKTTAFHLNEYAWGYVQLMTGKDDLETALKWSERSIELMESPINLDTYANLLSKLGRKKEAIKVQKKAIKMAKKQGIELEGFEQTLKEIKQN